MQVQSIKLDPTDIAPVRPQAIQAVIDLIVERGQSLILFHGASPAARADVNAAFWDAHTGDRVLANATIIRFWHLVDALATRRLKWMLLERGYAALAPLATTAATARLNVGWGFKPQTLVNALIEPTAQPKSVPARRRLAA